MTVLSSLPLSDEATLLKNTGKIGGLVAGSTLGAIFGPVGFLWCGSLGFVLGEEFDRRFNKLVIDSRKETELRDAEETGDVNETASSVLPGVKIDQSADTSEPREPSVDSSSVEADSIATLVNEVDWNREEVARITKAIAEDTTQEEDVLLQLLRHFAILHPEALADYSDELEKALRERPEIRERLFEITFLMSESDVDAVPQSLLETALEVGLEKYIENTVER